MLKFVTKENKSEKIEQLMEFTCFIIHVELLCIGENTYAG